MPHPIVDLALQKTEDHKLRWRPSVYPTRLLASLPKADDDGVLTLFLVKAQDGIHALTVRDEDNAELARVATPDLPDEDRDRLARLFDAAEKVAYGLGQDAEVIERSLQRL